MIFLLEFKGFEGWLKVEFWRFGFSGIKAKFETEVWSLILNLVWGFDFKEGLTDCQSKFILKVLKLKFLNQGFLSFFSEKPVKRKKIAKKILQKNFPNARPTPARTRTRTYIVPSQFFVFPVFQFSKIQK